MAWPAIIAAIGTALGGAAQAGASKKESFEERKLREEQEARRRRDEAMMLKSRGISEYGAGQQAGINTLINAFRGALGK
jgi:hypothetical protein